MIKSFSVKHKLQIRCPFLYFPTVLRICQETLGLFPSFLNLDRIRKKLPKCFKEENLNIEVMINMSEVNFLDVNLNIATGKIKPFRKPNNSLQYIHAESNHPKT